MFGIGKFKIRHRKYGSMLFEVLICVVIFILMSIFFSNFTINSVKGIKLNNDLSNDVLKIRELEVFLDSEVNQNSFDFKIKSPTRLTYKKIYPVNYSACEIKDRELRFTNNKLQLVYDDRNVTNLLTNIKSFSLYDRGNIINLKLELENMSLLKSISKVSYNV